MKLATATACLVAIGAAAAASALPAGIVELPAYDTPAQPWTDIAAPSRQLACRDRIEQVRAEAGKPAIEQGPADPDKPLMIHAVDQRIDGCGVLVPVADPSDIRQVPEAGREQLIPAR